MLLRLSVPASRRFGRLSVERDEKKLVHKRHSVARRLTKRRHMIFKFLNMIFKRREKSRLLSFNASTPRDVRYLLRDRYFPLVPASVKSHAALRNFLPFGTYTAILN